MTRPVSADERLRAEIAAAFARWERNELSDVGLREAVDAAFDASQPPDAGDRVRNLARVLEARFGPIVRLESGFSQAPSLDFWLTEAQAICSLSPFTPDDFQGSEAMAAMANDNPELFLSQPPDAGEDDLATSGGSVPEFGSEKA